MNSCFQIIPQNAASLAANESRKARLLVAITGIAFADLLMFVQLGVKDSLFDSQKPLCHFKGICFSQ